MGEATGVAEARKNLDGICVPLELECDGEIVLVIRRVGRWTCRH